MFQHLMYSSKVSKVCGVRKLFTGDIFKVVLPLSGAERNYRLQAFQLIYPIIEDIQERRCLCYLHRSAILRPDHVPPFHQ